MANYNMNQFSGNMQTARSTYDASMARHKDNGLILEARAQELLDTLVDDTLVFSSLLELRNIPVGSNFQIMWQRMDRIGNGQQLIEGVTPDAQSISYGAVKGTLVQMGKVISSTDQARDRWTRDPFDDQWNQLMFSAKETLDEFQRDLIISNAGNTWLPTITHYEKGKRIVTEKYVKSPSEITADMGFNWWDVELAQQTLIKLHAWNRRKGNLKLIMNSVGFLSLKADAWFVDSLHRMGRLDFWTQEVDSRYFNNIQFIDASTKMKGYRAGDTVVEWSDGPEAVAKVDLDMAILLAPNAGYQLSQSGFSGDHTPKLFLAAGSSKSDVLDQRTLGGYKFMTGGVIHTPSRVGLYIFASQIQATQLAGSMKMDLSYILPKTQFMTVKATNDFSETKTLLGNTALNLVLNEAPLLSKDDLQLGELYTENPMAPEFDKLPNGLIDRSKLTPTVLTEEIYKANAGNTIDVYQRVLPQGRATAKIDGFVSVHFTIHIPETGTASSTPPTGGETGNTGQ